MRVKIIEKALYNSQQQTPVLKTIIDQFNRDEQHWRRLQWRKLKRRVRFPKLGAVPRAILDMLDEMVEKQRPVDCVSSEWIGYASGEKRNVY